MAEVDRHALIPIVRRDRLDAVTIVVGSIIGSGIFLKVSNIDDKVPAFGAILAVWLVGGLATLCGSLSLAELAAMLPHAGGTFPALIGRMDHGTTVRPECRHMTKPPSSYLRRFHYDTITHNDWVLENLIEQVGADRVVMGSDCPADMSYTQPVAVVERLGTVPAPDREKIVGGTAARLLRLSDSRAYAE